MDTTTKTPKGDATGVSRSGRVRKKSSKLTDFESPDEIDTRFKRKTDRLPKVPNVEVTVAGKEMVVPGKSLVVGNEETYDSDAYMEDDLIDVKEEPLEVEEWGGEEEEGEEEEEEGGENFHDPLQVDDDSTDVSRETSGYTQAQSLYFSEKVGKKNLVVRDGQVVRRKKAQRKDKGKSRFTAYMLWAREVRPGIIQGNPNMDFSAVNKRLGELWALVPTTQKYNWKRRAKRLAAKGNQKGAMISTGRSARPPPSSRANLINKGGVKPAPRPPLSRPEAAPAPPIPSSGGTGGRHMSVQKAQGANQRRLGKRSHLLPIITPTVDVQPLHRESSFTSRKKMKLVGATVCTKVKVDSGVTEKEKKENFRPEVTQHSLDDDSEEMKDLYNLSLAQKSKKMKRNRKSKESLSPEAEEWMKEECFAFQDIKVEPVVENTDETSGTVWIDDGSVCDDAVDEKGILWVGQECGSPLNTLDGIEGQWIADSMVVDEKQLDERVVLGENEKYNLQADGKHEFLVDAGCSLPELRTMTPLLKLMNEFDVLDGKKSPERNEKRGAKKTLKTNEKTRTGIPQEKSLKLVMPTEISSSKLSTDETKLNCSVLTQLTITINDIFQDVYAGYKSQFCPSSLIRAVIAVVLLNVPITKAVSIYCISYNRLQKCIDNVLILQTIKKCVKYYRLTKEMRSYTKEDQVIEWMLRMRLMGRLPVPSDVHYISHYLGLEKLAVKVMTEFFTQYGEKQMTLEEWIHPQSCDIFRWSALFRIHLLAHYDLHPQDLLVMENNQRVFTATEILVSVNDLMEQVIVFRGHSNLYCLSKQTNGSTRAMLTFSAAGYFHPPLIVQSGYDLPCWANQPGDDVDLAASVDGKIDPLIFIGWLRMFDQRVTEAKIQRPVVLFIHCHPAHASPAAVAFCFSRKIILHSHHHSPFNPMDPFIHILTPLIHQLKISKDKLLTSVTTGPLPDCLLPMVLADAWKQLSEDELAHEAFDLSGLLPYNPEMHTAQTKTYLGSTRHPPLRIHPLRAYFPVGDSPPNLKFEHVKQILTTYWIGRREHSPIHDDQKSYLSRQNQDSRTSDPLYVSCEPVSLLTDESRQVIHRYSESDNLIESSSSHTESDMDELPLSCEIHESVDWPEGLMNYPSNQVSPSGCLQYIKEDPDSPTGSLQTPPFHLEITDIKSEQLIPEKSTTGFESHSETDTWVETGLECGWEGNGEGEENENDPLQLSPACSSPSKESDEENFVGAEEK